LGSAWGSLDTVIAFEREAHLQGARFVDPILFTETVSNVPAGQVAILYGWSAFNATVSSASASGLASLRQALLFLEEGRGSIAVAGGCDEVNAPVLRALRGRGLVAGTASSLPLSAQRSGPVGGEGAAFLTIEAEAQARERGAQPIAAIRGTEACFSPGGTAEPGAARHSMAALIRRLAERAGIAPRNVDLVALSASGSIDGDAEEAGAVVDVFGRGPSAPPVVAPKWIFGETWGASGALAVAIAVEAMRTSTVPGSPIGFVLDQTLDGLNVPSESLRRPMRNALILDRTDSGHQFGVLVSVVEPHDAGH
jgi:3-oxoacyl-[acyl-carrier-protein] synthase II